MVEFGLLDTIAIALALAVVGGLAARLIGLPPIVGYLAAGVVISPFTPGYDADPGSLTELAELGVIFLMFGVGLHFNVGDLWRVKTFAIPGAIVQVGVATLLGLAAASAFGKSWQEGVVLGLAI